MMDPFEEKEFGKEAIDIQKDKVSDADLLAQIIAQEQSRQLQTHKNLESNYVGMVESMDVGHAKTSFITKPYMKADTQDMVFSAFINAGAEYAAVAAVNEPNTMIIHSNVTYFSPIRLGDEVKFEAEVKHNDARKRDITVIGYINTIKVYKAVITVVITEYHPLKIELMDIATS